MSNWNFGAFKYAVHSHDPMEDAPRWARALNHKLGAILVNQEKIMIDTTQLKAQVARLLADDTAALAILQQVRDQNKDLAKQLADLAASSQDPAVQADLDQIAKQLSDSADTIETAVQSNPQTPDLPPAPSDQPAPQPAPTDGSQTSGQ